MYSCSLMALVNVPDVLLFADGPVTVLVHVLKRLQHHDVHHVVVVLGVEEGLELRLGQLAVTVTISLQPPPLVSVHHWFEVVSALWLALVNEAEDVCLVFLPGDGLPVP